MPCSDERMALFGPARTETHTFRVLYSTGTGSFVDIVRATDAIGACQSVVTSFRHAEILSCRKVEGS